MIFEKRDFLSSNKLQAAAVALCRSRPTPAVPAILKRASFTQALSQAPTKGVEDEDQCGSRTIATNIKRPLIEWFRQRILNEDA